MARVSCVRLSYPNTPYMVKLNFIQCACSDVVYMSILQFGQQLFAMRYVRIEAAELAEASIACRTLKRFFVTVNAFVGDQARELAESLFAHTALVWLFARMHTQMRFQIAELDEFLVAHGAFEELRCIRVDQHVNVKMIASLEFPAASIAIERQIPIFRIVFDFHDVSMRLLLLMLLLLLSFCLGLASKIAIAARQSLQHFVCHQILHIADAVRIHRLIAVHFVRTLMGTQCTRLMEFHGTCGAFVGPEIEMGALVCFQSGQLAEIFGAQIACVGLFVGVDAIVRLQIALLAERLEANGAFERCGLFVRMTFHVNGQSIVVGEILAANGAFVLLSNGDHIGGGRTCRCHRHRHRRCGCGRQCCCRNMLILLIRIGDGVQFHIVDVVLYEIGGNRTDLLIVREEIQRSIVLYD